MPRHADASVPPPQRPRPSCCGCCGRFLPAALTTIEERCSASTDRVLGLDVVVSGRANGGARSTLAHPERLAAHLHMFVVAYMPRVSVCRWVRGRMLNAEVVCAPKRLRNLSRVLANFSISSISLSLKHVGARFDSRRCLYCWRARHR